MDFDENEVIARHGELYFKDVPILYSPWLSFPLKKERKSGFFLPTYGMSSNSGIEIAAPYYFNIAPNYDATLTPRYLSKRSEERRVGKSVSVRVDLGGRRIIKKKINKAQHMYDIKQTKTKT